MDFHQFIQSVTLYVVYTIILSLLYSVHMGEGAPASARLEYFPGFSGKLRSDIYTGYVTVDEAHERELFYYFVKSEKNPENDPLLLWLTGGPGCSSFSGFMYENGPFYFNLNETSESLPKVHENPDSWSKVSSIIFLDSPVGTGFSYSNTTEDYVTGDVKTVSDVYAFLIKWLEEYPEFLPNPMYIAGDSYSGIFVPMVAQKIVNGNEAGMKHMNFKGYMVGNGAADPMFDSNSKVPFAHGMGLISDELYQAVKEACNGSYWNPTGDACMSKMLAVWQNLFGLYPNHILDPLCFWSVEKKQARSSDENLNRSSKKSAFSEYLLETWRLSSLIRLKSSKCLDGQLQLGQQDDPCAVDPYKFSITWANNPSVRKAIHAKTEEIIGSWRRCGGRFIYNYEVESVIEYHLNLTRSGYRALIYSGDHDMVVPYIGSQSWITSLGYATVDDWRSWIVDGQVAGYTRTYENNLTFTTIKGAGHTAPEYKPRESFEMFNRWVFQNPI